MTNNLIVAALFSLLAIPAIAADQSIQREQPAMAADVAKDRLGAMTNQMTAKIKLYTLVTKNGNPGAFDPLKPNPADVALFRAGTMAVIPLTMAGRSAEIYNQEHTLWRRLIAYFGDDSAQKDSEQPFTNPARTRACNLEIIAANDSFQKNFKDYAAAYPHAEMVKEFAAAGVLLAEGAKRAKEQPTVFPYSLDDDTIHRLTVATATAKGMAQNDELRQIAGDEWLRQLFGNATYSNVAPDFELTHSEATRDLTAKVAASCMPPELTQKMRNASMPSYFQRRDAIAASLRN